MATPSYRVPVRVARGTLAALTTGLSDLQEGEICYATDENSLYVVEGGVLTIAGTNASGDLVDDTTPQLGGALDVNGNEIVSLTNANILVAPDGTGVLEIRGNTGNDAAIQLNCEANTHGVKIKSPPHSAAASYTLVLPENTGTTGQALTTDGAGVLSWATSSAVGSIDDLNDVDTTTTAPTNDQVLAWDGTNWVPADAATGGGGGAVDSVNGQTGVVSLGVEDMDDYSEAPPFSSTGSWTQEIVLYAAGGTETPDASGEWSLYETTSGSAAIFIHKQDSNAVDHSTLLALVIANPTNYSFRLKTTVNPSLSTVVNFTAATALSNNRYRLNYDPADLDPANYNTGGYSQDNEGASHGPFSNTLEIEIDLASNLASTAPTDGQVLTWVNASNRWQPADAATGGGGDPLFSKVTALATFDGETNGASTWTTYGSTSPTWTTNSATISSAQTRWGGTTSLSVGAGAPSIPMQLGTDDWTIETWVMLDQGTWSSFGSIFKNGVLVDTYDVIYVGPNGSNTSARFRVSNSNSSLLTITGTCQWHDDEWNHVAICRAGDIYSAYVNGEKVGSGVQSGRTFNSGDLEISGSGSSTAYVQDFRVTSGVARYSTEYYPVPTSPLSTN